MTKRTLIKKLKEVSKNNDTEVAHAIADDLLIVFINDKAIAKAYNNVPKWYA